MTMKSLLPLPTLALFFSGAVFAQSGLPPSGKVGIEQLRAMQMQLMQAYSGAMQPAAVPVTHKVPVAITSEAELAAKLAAFPARPEHLVIEDRKDGFIANGSGYIDPEGTIRNYAVDIKSGLATCLVNVDQANYQIKVLRAGTEAESQTISSAVRTDNGWQVDTLAGKRIVGQSLTMLPGAGFLVMRDTAAFIYRMGQGVQSIAIPGGYVAARFQRGDVLGTHHLLLERDVSEATQAEGLFDSMRSLGSSLGINNKEDFALLNLKNGELIPINISNSGKNVGSYSNCRRQNNLVQRCSTMEFRESLYDATGRNLSHYYWRINWFDTPTGPMLIAQENGLKDITIRDLKTGKKTVAFSRALGIAGHDSTQDDSGRVRITAQMGFSTEKIDDAAAFLASASIPTAISETRQQ